MVYKTSQMVLLKSLAIGLSLKEIAEELGVSYNTIKTRTKLLYKKFEANSRIELIYKALELNLITRKDIKTKFRKRFILKIKSEKNIIEPLTQQEITYLSHKANGLNAKQIIEIMNLTGIYHAKYLKLLICYKLNSKNITQAVYNAKLLNII